MAKLRLIKRDIAYLTGEVISNCYLALYFQGEGAQAKVEELILKAVELHNSLIERANHPAEKNNPRLVRKHYAALRADLLSGVDDLFTDLSKVCAQS